MKSSNTVVTVVVIGAVLAAAYAVGLLVRHARTGDSSSLAPPAREVNEARIREDMAKLVHGPGTRQTKDTQQEMTRLTEKRAAALKRMESATEQEKAQVREQIRERFSAPSGQQAVRRPVPEPTGAAAVPPAQDPNASKSPDKTDSEPNRAGRS
jgi:hypothetical protein